MSDIAHRENQSRFETTVDGQRCELDYVLRDHIMTIVHTDVPAPVGGRGIAAELTRAALDTARQRGWKVVPQCSYAAVYLKRHPEYQDLQA
ncbi:N-acetyltransferase [Bordetella bronchiseptica]|uniref:GNAT family N-acetyltransferase n=1 Tax=Bordetella bronchiseptica TaxID=518 RepID=UPI00143E6165|nr:GNAT family N-acetyltransferase [Bordetella bronchiseptica]QIY02533.1 N-acetyltransferase [Bordetella bronchiseptica]